MIQMYKKTQIRWIKRGMFMIQTNPNVEYPSYLSGMSMI